MWVIMDGIEEVGLVRGDDLVDWIEVEVYGDAVNLLGIGFIGKDFPSGDVGTNLFIEGSCLEFITDFEPVFDWGGVFVDCDLGTHRIQIY